MGTMKRLFCASFVAVVTSASPLWAANSCSNVATMGNYDRSGIEEYGNDLSAVGTFRIEEEKDENKQPDFNLVTISCNSIPGNSRTKPATFVCTMTQASVRATSEQPNTDKPNCTLDVDVTEYHPNKPVPQKQLS